MGQCIRQTNGKWNRGYYESNQWEKLSESNGVMYQTELQPNGTKDTMGGPVEIRI
jgi:hypothetical protein